MSKHLKIIIVIGLIVFFTIDLSFIARAKGLRDFYYKIDSYFEVQEIPYPQNITLTKKQGDIEEEIGQVILADEYLISGIPENEFLDKFKFFQIGVKDVKLSIEADKPLFGRQNFKKDLSLAKKAKNFFGMSSLPEYRIVREIQDEPERIGTNLNFPGLEFKTSYERLSDREINEEEKLKQEFFLKNNLSEELNLQVTLSYSFSGDRVFFGDKMFYLSSNPQSLSPGESNIVRFNSVSSGKNVTYDFADLIPYNPEIWIFKRGTESILLSKISISIPSNSTIVIDPLVTVMDPVFFADATGFSFQRKTWYDGDRYWVSFYDSSPERPGTRFCYASSSSGPFYGNNNAIIPNYSNDFCVVGDDKNLFILYAYSTTTTVGRVFIAQADTSTYPGVDWEIGATTTLFQPGAQGQIFNRVHLNRNASGNLFALARRRDGPPFGTYQIYVRKSELPNSISSWSSGYSLVSSAFNNLLGVSAPRNANDDMFFVYQRDINYEARRYWDSSSSWDSVTTTLPMSTGQQGCNSTSSNFSVTTDLGVSERNYRTHLAGCIYNPLARGYYINYWQGSTSFDCRNTLMTGSRSLIIGPTISARTFGDTTRDLYCIWAQNDKFNDVIVYATAEYPFAKADWSNISDCATDTLSISHITSCYDSGDSENIFLEYTLAPATSVKFFSFFGDSGGGGNNEPTVGSVILNEGDDITLVANTTTLVVSTTTVSDGDGYSDIAKVFGALYRSGAGPGPIPNDNYRYEDNNCSTSSCAGNSCTATCEFDIWFHADPTDIGDFSAQWWQADISVQDKSDATSTASTSQDVNTLSAIDISTSTIDYGSLAPGESNDPLDKLTTATTTGNVAIDAKISGTNMFLEGGGDSDWYSSDWSYRKQLTIDHDEVDSNLEGFPVLVSTTSNFLKHTSHSGKVGNDDGTDILFTQSNGTTKIPHEMEYYASTTGELIAWVKSDLSSSEDTNIYMYYGNSGASDQQQATSTWDDNFLCVQHMNESSGNVIDSTDSDNDSTVVGGTPGYGSTGQIGDSIYIGANEGFGLKNFGKLNTDGNQITIESWVKRVSAGIYAEIVAKYDNPVGADPAAEWLLRFQDNNTLSWYINDTGEGNDQYKTTNTFTDTSNWHHFAVVHEAGDGSKAHIYYDGVEDTSASWTTNGNSLPSNVDYIVSLGNLYYRSAWNEQELFGYQDEVRISNTIRSPAWIAASYSNQSSTSAFLSFGEEEEEEIDEFIPIENEHYATSSIAYDSGYVASSTAVTLEFGSTKPTSHPSTATQDIYWGVEIPSGATFGDYNGTNTYSAGPD